MLKLRPNVLGSILPRYYLSDHAGASGGGGGGGGPKSSEVQNQLKSMVEAKDIVVFMKGVPERPQCGFSNAVVQILAMHGVHNYDAHNVLEDNDIREGVKVFANWPTIPQVYFKGEFMGGCEILLHMHQSGELVEELKKLGIRSRLLDAPPPKNDSN